MSSPVQLKAGRAVLRAITAAEMDMLYHSWLNSYRKTSLKTREAPDDVFEREQRKLIARMLKRPTVVVACAVDPEDDTNVYGWLAGELRSYELVVHYAFTKKSFRRFGVMNSLLSAFRNGSSKPLYYTHWTHHSDKIAPHYAAIYNPWMVFAEEKLG